MTLTLREKQVIVNHAIEVMQGSLSVVVADAQGITSNKMNQLRKASRKEGVIIKILRNTLLSRTLNKTKFHCLKKFLVGPNLLACSTKHPRSGARLLNEFAKANKGIKIKAACFEENLLLGSQIDGLANLPTRDEIIGHLITVMKEATVGKLLRTLNAIRDTK